MRRSVEVHGQPIQLTYVEFELLRTLAANPGRVFSRRRLLESLWGDSAYREPRTIDVHVRHLREKLERRPQRAGVHPHGARGRLPLSGFVNPSGPVGLKLTLALAGLVAGALAIVYLAVVPSLEDRLIDWRLDQLERRLRAGDRKIVGSAGGIGLDLILSDEGQQRGVRLTVFDYLDQEPIKLIAVGDSRQLGAALWGRSGRAGRSRAGRIERGVVERGGTQFAEVAVPFGDRILLVAAPIEDTLDTVTLVERRLLLAA